MQKQRRGIILAKFTTLVCCLVMGAYADVSCARADDDECENYEDETTLEICQDTTWHSSDNLDFKKTVSIYSGATLTIEKGAHIKFSKDSDGRGTKLIVFGGRLVAAGEQNAPIDITSDSDRQSQLIEFYGRYYDDDPAPELSFLRYVEIHGVGYEVDGGGQSSFWQSFAPSVYAKAVGGPAVKFFGGKAHFENCTFRDNAYADVAVKYDEDDFSAGEWSYLEIVNSNFEKSNNSSAVISELKCKDETNDCYKKVFLKNNWYGDSSGPSEVTTSRTTNGKIISGTYELDDWRKNDLIVDPVIFIPGILGSAPQTLLGGQLVLDPIMHIYDNLVLSFEKNGYETNKNLFEFPYEWRDSNVQTADLLKKKIDEVKTDTKVSQVDLVGHSMGGLVARYYIESQSYDNRNDVNHLITLGTPHRGAPSDYLTWEAGEGFFTREDKIAKALFQMEAAHATGSPNLKDYIQSRVLSVRDLLPDYNYLKEASSGDVRNYPHDYPNNTFLDFLNRQTALDNLNKVDFVNIVGKLKNKEDTITGLKVVNGSEWDDGMPEDYGNSNRGIEYGKGDETVPLESSEGIEINAPVEIDTAHNDLPTVAQCEVIDRLTGKNNCTDNYVDTVRRIIHILTFGVYSPIDIQIIAPDGVHWAGKNILGLFTDNRIAGAYYTGFDTDNEFVTIPNPEKGDYKIISEGTGEGGSYTVKMANISESSNGQAQESSAQITGIAESGQRYENKINVADFVVEYDGETVVDNSETNLGSEGDNSENNDTHHANKKKKSSVGSISQKHTALLSVFENKKGDIDQKLWPSKNEGHQSKEVAGDATVENEPVKNKEVSSHWMAKLAVLLIAAGVLAGGTYLWRKRRET